MYRSFVGLEIHIQLLTQSKVFCSCRANYGDEPNSNICPVCMGYPGVLPALNKEAMKLSYVVARALNCTLSSECTFERKNYFYPDLPKNYQISQFAAPLGTNGYLDLEFRKHKRRVRIRECHLEEDAGKMIHAGDQSLLDFNRTGTPLLEIVTEPDLEIGEEAEVLLQEFRRLVRYLGVCDGNMEEGSLRCDANVSVNTEGAGLGTKVEIKNMNSFRFVRKALNYEIARQQDILERGGTIVQETRLWNENRDVSESMRVKESSNDYRYFPEPDLPPFRPSAEFLASVDAAQVEFPRDRMARFVREFGLSENQAAFVCDERQVADYFETVVGLGAEPQTVAAWLMGDVQKCLNRHGLRLEQSPLGPERLSAILDMLKSGRIHGKIAKQVLDAVFMADQDPEQIITERGWEQLTDRAVIRDAVREVLRESGDAVKQIQSGDARPRGFLVGQVMKKTSGRADPSIVQDLLNEELAVTFVQVISFGGAISGSRRDDGIIVGGALDGLVNELRSDSSLPGELRYEELALGEFLSEEVTPHDWAGLIATVTAHVRSGDPSGIVISHGTDTLAYTASLLAWLFSDSPVPIVLAASTGPSDSDEARTTLRQAVEHSLEASGGVHVAVGGEIFPPLNLRFERLPGAGGRQEFRTWNADAPLESDLSFLGHEELDVAEIAARLETAVRRSHIVKVFPGLQALSLTTLIDGGIRYFVLELYDSGTASVGESPFSMRRALQYGHEHRAAFFCTSQQEGNVDFSEYVTSHELWREGAVPMGALATESAYTRLLAVQLIAGETEESDIVRSMEI